MHLLQIFTIRFKRIGKGRSFTTTGADLDAIATVDLRKRWADDLVRNPVVTANIDESEFVTDAGVEDRTFGQNVLDLIVQEIFHHNQSLDYLTAHE